MQNRKWFIGAVVILAAVAVWQIWESETSITVSETSHAIVRGPLTILAPAADMPPEPLPVIELSKAFVIEHPPGAVAVEPPLAPPPELLPPPGILPNGPMHPAPTGVVPASFRQHSADPSDASCTGVVWDSVVSFFRNKFSHASSLLTPEAPTYDLRVPQSFRPEEHDFRHFVLEAERTRIREMQSRFPQLHPGCPYQGGGPYDGSSYQNEKAATRPLPQADEKDVTKPIDSKDLRKNPKIDTLEIRPTDLPRGWFGGRLPF